MCLPGEFKAFFFFWEIERPNVKKLSNVRMHLPNIYTLIYILFLSVKSSEGEDEEFVITPKSSGSVKELYGSVVSANCLFSG